MPMSSNSFLQENELQQSKLWKAVVHPKQFCIEYRTNVGN